MKFIHDNFIDYIMTTNDDECKEQYELSLGCSPPNKLAYGIVWKGTKIEQDFEKNYMMCLECDMNNF